MPSVVDTSEVPRRFASRVAASSTLVLVLAPFLSYASFLPYLWATTADPGTALAWLKNPGPHGFSEMLYEFTSAAANNGSGFEGLGDNTPFWNIATGLVMLLSRYIPILAPLALAGFLAIKPTAPDTAGSLQADTATFGFTLWAVIVILGLLMFMPVAVLERGTRSGARALRSLLADLGGLMTREAVKSPAIIVVGEVVLRSDAEDRLLAFANMAEAAA